MAHAPDAPRVRQAVLLAADLGRGHRLRDRAGAAGVVALGRPRMAGRSRPLSSTGVTIAVEDAPSVAELWSEILGSTAEHAGVRFHPGPGAGLVEIELESAGLRGPVQIGRVRFSVG